MAIVLDAALSGYCNTARDIADVTGLRIEIASARVHELICAGVLRRTRRTVPSLRKDGSRGKGYVVFEVAR